MDYAKERQKLEGELAEALAGQSRTLHSEAHPETLSRIEGLRRRLDQTKQMQSEAASRAGVTAANGSDAGAVAAHLEVLREERRKCRTPLEEAAWDDRRAAELGALESRLDTLTATTTTAAPAVDAATAAARVTARAEYQRLAATNPVAAAAFRERFGEGVATGGT